MKSPWFMVPATMLHLQPMVLLKAVIFVFDSFLLALLQMWKLRLPSPSFRPFSSEAMTCLSISGWTTN